MRSRLSLLIVALAAIVVPGTASAQQADQKTPAAQTPAAQSDAAAQTDVDKLPISLDRIREQLAREPLLSANLLRALNIPTFRTETRSEIFKPDPNWWKDDNVGSYVRPTVNKWQYDFMKMTNPNVPTGYGPGSGVDVLPAVRSVFSGIKHAFQDREAARVRQQIQDELRQINEARRAAGLPPVDDSSTTTRQPE